MSRKDRLRRVVTLCSAFARNLAYYRVGRTEKYRRLFNPAKTATWNFWRMANSNSLDMCVLDWCKLFADRKGAHHWGKIVTDPPTFKTGLLVYLGVDETTFQKEINRMLHYRDKFVAHLDSDHIMNIPSFDVAKKAVWFYHAHVVRHEAKAGDLAGLPVQLGPGHGMAEAEARAVFQLAASQKRVAT
jgi:hypothetical protein